MSEISISIKKEFWKFKCLTGRKCKKLTLRTAFCLHFSNIPRILRELKYSLAKLLQLIAGDSISAIGDARGNVNFIAIGIGKVSSASFAAAAAAGVFLWFLRQKFDWINTMSRAAPCILFSPGKFSVIAPLSSFLLLR